MILLGPVVCGGANYQILEARDVHADFLEVRKGKGEKDRIVPLTASLSLRLQNFISENNIKPDERIFGLKPACISNKIRQFADKAGFKDLHTHTLRHKFATDLVENGTNLKVVQELMGHENLNTTQVYISVTDKSKREAIKSLEIQPESSTPNGLTPEVENTVIEPISIELPKALDPTNIIQALKPGSVEDIDLSKLPAIGLRR